jgi:hypothetical protein
MVGVELRKQSLGRSVPPLTHQSLHALTFSSSSTSRMPVLPSHFPPAFHPASFRCPNHHPADHFHVIISRLLESPLKQRLSSSNFS